MTTDEFFTIERAAVHLGVSTRTLRRWIKAGRLDAQLRPGPYGQQYLVPRSSIAGIEIVRDVGRAERQAERETLPQIVEGYLQERESALVRQLRALQLEVHAAMRRVEERQEELMRRIDALTAEVRALSASQSGEGSQTSNRLNP